MIEAFIARIFDNNGQPVGAGVLVTPDQVLTCAHVIQRALGNRFDFSSLQKIRVVLDFPHSKSEHSLNSEIKFFNPQWQENTHDIALLRILETEQIPLDVSQGKLLISDYLKDYKFETYGFPKGLPNGIGTAGYIRGLTGEGLFQLEVERDRPYVISLGFSGAPIWDVESKKIVGLVSKIDKETKRAAFAIPVRYIINLVSDIPYTKELSKKYSSKTSANKNSECVESSHYFPKDTDFIGRKTQLRLLTSWSEGKVDGVSVYSIVAVPGNGKTTLAWEWFRSLKNRNRQWWSFYQDPNFDRFILSTIKCFTGQTLKDIEKQDESPLSILLRVLDEEEENSAKHVIVLDGLERITHAFRAGTMPLNEQIESEYLDVVDPQITHFLNAVRELRNVQVLITSIFDPSPLILPGNKDVPNSKRLNLNGFSVDKAFEFWHALGCSGPRDLLSELFESYEYHPLQIKTVAFMIVNDDNANGDLTLWLKNDDSRTITDLASEKGKIMPITTLQPFARRVLHLIAAIRKPTFNNLHSLLNVFDFPLFNRPSAQLLKKVLLKGNRVERKLKKSLSLLSRLGLIYKIKDENSIPTETETLYSIHPYIRGEVLKTIDPKMKRKLYTKIAYYFSQQPEAILETNMPFSDIVPDIELFNAFIQLGQLEKACEIFKTRLDKGLIDNIGNIPEALTLLRLLVPLGSESINPERNQITTYAHGLFFLARAFQYGDQPSRAIDLHSRAMLFCEGTDETKMIDRVRVSLADAYLSAGNIRESLRVTKEVLDDEHTEETDRAWIWLQYLIMTYMNQPSLNKSLLSDLLTKEWRNNELTAINLAQGLLRSNNYELAIRFSEKAIMQAKKNNLAQRISIRGERIIGAAHLCLSEQANLSKRDQRQYLNKGITFLKIARRKAQKTSYAEVEYPGMVELAKVEWLKEKILGKNHSDINLAKTYLQTACHLSALGHYSIVNAYALNTWAQIEIDWGGDFQKARECLTEAYELAHCSDKYYVYKRGIEDSTYLANRIGLSLASSVKGSKSSRETLKNDGDVVVEIPNDFFL